MNAVRKRTTITRRQLLQSTLAAGAAGPQGLEQNGRRIAHRVVQTRDFVRKLVAFRKANGHAFAPAEYGSSAPFSWKSAANTEEPDWNSLPPELPPEVLRLFVRCLQKDPA